ncbi:MAG TPA: hypothetical protein VNK82_00500 [Terriglobales bacterium]|nr:hypothetical protein [Terriglobales bacterium]
MKRFDVVFEPSPTLIRQLRLLAALGGFAFVAALLFAPERAWPNLLLVSYYLTGLSLAGVVFVALGYVADARWSIALRRVPEAMAYLLPVGGAGLLAVIFLHPEVYPWANADFSGHMPAFRQMWLSLPFFRLRTVVYLLLWTLFIWAMLRASRRQDAEGDVEYTHRNQRLSAGFLVAFGLTYWLASFDWIMSLEPEWYSTVFGLYNFAGLFLGGLAAITVVVVWLHGQSRFQGFFTTQHLHDLGKLLFAFSTFWAYLWFCQFMLIWYANIPEETAYFIRRHQGMWEPLFYLNVFVNWVAPFLLLMRRASKRKPGVLLRISLVLLAGRWLDLHLMIAPPLCPGRPCIGIWELAMAAGAAGLFALLFLRVLEQAPVIPVKDPHLADSLHYHA